MEKVLKGQMFVIAAIFFIVGFVLLRSVLSLPLITQEKTFQETSIMERNIKNIAHEYEEITGTASLQPDINRSINEYVYNFTNYTIVDMNMQTIYLGLIHNSTSGKTLVTVGNFLGRTVAGSVNISSVLKNFSLGHREYVPIVFTPGSGVQNVTLVYDNLVREKLYFNASARNTVAGFFDLSIEDGQFFVRSKSVYNRTW